MPDYSALETTLLSTNIEASAGVWNQISPSMTAFFARYDSILSGVIKTHGGQIFQTNGAAFNAVFSNPADALQAALEGQQTLKNIEAEDCPAIGMVLLSGYPLKEGNALNLPAVNRLAALQATAHGGQILVGGETFKLLHHRLPDGIKLHDLGEHYLKDLNGPERIYQVLGEGFAQDFPPLRSLNHHPHNLPLQLKRLIGREQELEKALKLLKQPDKRLLTFYGAGGAGKTRLCMQIAAEKLYEYPDGVFVVELENFSQPLQLMSAIARVLNLNASTGRDLIENLKQNLRQRKLLLVLDGFENILSASSLVADLLASAPNLTIMVTSRMVLKVYGEQEFAVSPLPLPDLTGIPQFNRLISNPAVRLFVERTCQIYPDFEINRPNILNVARICQRLDGLPLAIELVAARCKDFTPGEILEQLSSPLPVIAAETDELPPRHRSIGATFSWSYDMLDEAEQELLIQLSVFAGGCTLEAVGALIEELDNQGLSAFASDNLDVLDGISSLVDKGLLQQKETTGFTEPHFFMLETIRELAYARLVASPVFDQIRQVYMGYYLKLAQEAEVELTGPNQADWFKRLEREHANFRAILNQLLFPCGDQSANPELALQMGSALWRFWLLNHNIHEGLLWLEKGLELLPSDQNLTLRAIAGNATGILLRELGNYPAALKFLEQSVQIQRSLNDEKGLGATLNSIGTVLNVLGEYDKAIEINHECIALRRKLGENRGVALSLCSLAGNYYYKGEMSAAISYLEEALLIFRPLQDKRAISLVLNNLGEITRKAGNYATAQTCLVEGLALQRELGDQAAQANTLLTLGELALAQAQMERAEGLFRESLQILQKIRNIRLITDCLEYVAIIAGSANKPEYSAQLIGSAEVLREMIGIPVPGEMQEMYQANLSQLRAILTDDGFEAARQAGRALSLEEVFENLFESPITIL